MADPNVPVPPPELVQQWLTEIWHEGTPVRVAQSDLHLAAQAARWGADQELEACCEWLQNAPFGLSLNKGANQLRLARRPKPPSLKEQALGAFSRADKDAITNPLTGEVVALRTILSKEQSDTIRRALESLPS